MVVCEKNVQCVYFVRGTFLKANVDEALQLTAQYWDMASNKEKKTLVYHPSKIPSWIKLCKEKLQVQSIISKPDRRTRRLHVQMEKDKAKQEMASARLVIDGTGPSNRAVITQDIQWGMTQSDIDIHFNVIYNSSKQDGYNCLYIAMKTFDTFSSYSIEQLRHVAAESISTRVASGEFSQQHIYEAHNAKKLSTILQGV